MRLIIRGGLWLGLYLTMVLFPLLAGAVLIDPADSPFFAVNLSAALGYIGLALMAAELALVSRLDGASGAFGLDSLLQFHRQIGIASLGFVAAHPVLLVAAGAYRSGILVPSLAMPWPVSAGVLAFVATLLVVGLSVLRRRIRLSYEAWQVTHGAFSILLIVAAGAHILGIGRFAALPAMQAIWGVYLGVFLGLFVRYKFVRPLMLLRKPWEVAENRAELGNSRTVTLRPVGHEGFAFEPGQFAWINFGRSPFSFSQHPISFSSNGEKAKGGTIAFTIKNLGDWSGEVVPALKPGTCAWVDGPHGVFTVDREEGPGYVLIGGGVGITPLYSMILALETRGDVRPIFLFHGANEAAELIFRDEITALNERMDNLTVVTVLVDSDERWTGERGFITPEMLQRYLPERLYRRFQYFVCGPTPLMDAMERALPGIDVPAERIHTERFDMV